MTLHDMIQFEKEESFDEGVAFGEARGIETGMKNGIETGIMQGASIYISSLREYNIQDEQILGSVIQKFGISKEKAMELMAL